MSNATMMSNNSVAGVMVAGVKGEVHSFSIILFVKRLKK